jgi:hypothetical protein
MEWEVMFLCNTIGVLLLIFIAFFHLIGVDKEDHGEVIDTNSGAQHGVEVGAGSSKASK